MIYGLPWITSITSFWSLVWWFANNFYSWLCHLWKLLANHLTCDQKPRYSWQVIYHSIYKTYSFSTPVEVNQDLYLSQKISEYPVHYVRTPLTCTNRPMLSWWLQMPWCQIGTRSSATTVLTQLWLQYPMNHIMQYFHCIAAIQQTMLWRGLEVDNPWIFFSCDQAALRTLLSVPPSVRLSICHTVLTVFLSSYHSEIFSSHYHWQTWCPCKRSRSKVKVTEVMIPFHRFQTVTKLQFEFTYGDEMVHKLDVA